VTGLTKALVYALARRDQFPFLHAGEVGKWGDYSGRVAFKTLLALGLANVGGTQSEAGHFVEREFDVLAKRGVAACEPAALQTYFGYAKLGAAEFEPETRGYVAWTTSEALCGTLDDVARQARDIAPRMPSWPIAGIVLVNASLQLRALRERLIEQGVGGDVIGEIGLAKRPKGKAR
jgi:hypothetical protein